MNVLLMDGEWYQASVLTRVICNSHVKVYSKIYHLMVSVVNFFKSFYRNCGKYVNHYCTSYVCKCDALQYCTIAGLFQWLKTLLPFKTWPKSHTRVLMALHCPERLL